MSKHRLRFLWFDDNPGRQRTGTDLGDALDADVEFVSLHNKDVLGALRPWLTRPKPALVIIDHVLNNTKHPDGPLSRGSSVAEVLREVWPTVPIVGVTAAGNFGSISVHNVGLYDQLYQFTDFRAAIPDFPVIASGFSRLSKARFSTLAGFMKYIDPPETDVPRLTTIVPDGLRSRFGDASYASRAFDWVVGTLFARPGFLYDELWTATLLGIRPAALPKVAERFAAGRYEGVFALPSQPRWWATLLKELLPSQFEKLPPFQWPWELGAQLPGISPRDHSKCEYCREPFPEIVGYLDDDSGDRGQLHIRCTVAHPQFSDELFFEEIRMMRDR